MGDTKDKMNIKKVSVIITLYTRKGINESTMFYLKAKIYSSEVLSPQEANRNLPEGKIYQYQNDRKEDWNRSLLPASSRPFPWSFFRTNLLRHDPIHITL